MTIQVYSASFRWILLEVNQVSWGGGKNSAGHEMSLLIERACFDYFLWGRMLEVVLSRYTDTDTAVF
jgi:hypothetical protein